MKISSSRAACSALVLGGLWMMAAVAGRADEPGVKDTIKRDAREVGQGVTHGAKMVGSTVKNTSKQAGHAIARDSRAAGQSLKQEAKQAGHAVAVGAHDLKHKVAGDSSH